MIHTKTKLACLIIVVGIIFLLVNSYWPLRPNVESATDVEKIDVEKYKDIIVHHPRVFITDLNKAALRNKAQGALSDAYALLTRRIKPGKHQKISRKLEDLKDYIYK